MYTPSFLGSAGLMARGSHEILANLSSLAGGSGKAAKWRRKRAKIFKMELAWLEEWRLCFVIQAELLALSGGLCNNRDLGLVLSAAA